MVEKYKIVYTGGMDEVVEKKSRFIATVYPIKTEEEAVAYIEGQKKKYWDARHNCFAYTLGDKNQIQRMSDDGEPSGTAGRPMLDVLLGEEIHDVLVVVTRYFGGTLLGTGGLVRAYSKAVQAGLKESQILEKCKGKLYCIGTDYNGIGKLQYIAGQMGLTTIHTEYTDIVEIQLMVPMELSKEFEKKVTEATNGKAVIQVLKEMYFGVMEGEVILLPDEETSNL